MYCFPLPTNTRTSSFSIRKTVFMSLWLCDVVIAQLPNPKEVKSPVHVPLIDAHRSESDSQIYILVRPFKCIICNFVCERWSSASCWNIAGLSVENIHLNPNRFGLSGGEWRGAGRLGQPLSTSLCSKTLEPQNPFGLRFVFKEGAVMCALICIRREFGPEEQASQSPFDSDINISVEFCVFLFICYVNIMHMALSSRVAKFFG